MMLPSHFCCALFNVRWPDVARGKVSVLLLVQIGVVLRTGGSVWQPVANTCVLAFLGLFGYLINDWYDRSDDLLAGKRNFFASTKVRYRQRVAAFLVSLAITALVLATLTAKNPGVTLCVLMAQLVMSWAYSSPPARLKGRGAVGYLTVLMAQYLLPGTFVILATPGADLGDAILVLGLMALSGACLELGHQISDTQADALTRTRTLAFLLSSQRAHMVYHILLAFLGAAYLTLPAYLLVRAYEANGPVFLITFGAPVFFSMLATGTAAFLYVGQVGLSGFDPFFASRGDVMDRLYTTWPNSSSLLYLGGVVAPITLGAIGLLPVVVIWVVVSMPHLSITWHLREILRLAIPPELVGRAQL